MEISQLRYFLAVAEAGSFTRGAERCRITQPALSEQIRKLEERLGQRLFDRLPRGVMLTEAGELLLGRARRIVGEVNAIDAALRADLDHGRGPLRIGAIPTMAPYLLPPLLERFVPRYPDAELAIREDLTERLIEALLDQELELAIMSAPVADQTLQLQIIARERLVLATPRDYDLSKAPDRLTPNDLRNEPAVVLHEMHCLGQQIESFCARRRLTRRIVCRSTQLATVQHLVALGLGVSFVPEMCARADRAGLCRYLPLRRGPTREIAVAYRVDRTLSSLSRAVIEMLRAVLGPE